ncbi:protein of unknown function [Methylorubrum extorquens]|uniref:Uncharacterized protein n=1 Tax=Methylorubrum extorquens TaxID=408 RepID=A0A2N9AWA9_METEX|nr:protein of unknown function [Methylorubrum extorquens]
MKHSQSLGRSVRGDISNVARVPHLTADRIAERDGNESVSRLDGSRQRTVTSASRGPGDRSG